MSQELTIKLKLNPKSETPINKQDIFELLDLMTFEDKTLLEWEEITED